MIFQRWKDWTRMFLINPANNKPPRPGRPIDRRRLARLARDIAPSDPSHPPTAVRPQPLSLLQGASPLCARRPTLAPAGHSMAPGGSRGSPVPADPVCSPDALHHLGAFIEDAILGAQPADLAQSLEIVKTINI